MIIKEIWRNSTRIRIKFNKRPYPVSGPGGGSLEGGEDRICAGIGIGDIDPPDPTGGTVADGAEVPGPAVGPAVLEEDLEAEAPEGLAEVPEDLEAAVPEAVAAVPDRSILPDNEAALQERRRFIHGDPISDKSRHGIPGQYI